LDERSEEFGEPIGCAARNPPAGGEAVGGPRPPAPGTRDGDTLDGARPLELGEMRPGGVGVDAGAIRDLLETRRLAIGERPEDAEPDRIGDEL
jgi:hypothetical protein